jgi:hypothetical protein
MKNTPLQPGFLFSQRIPRCWVLTKTILSSTYFPSNHKSSTNKQPNNTTHIRILPITNYQHHHLLLIMIFTLSSVHAALKKFLEEEFECAICLETCTDTLVNPECNHRFCGKCIKESLHKCNHECPTCRVPIPTYRTCRRDAQFDHIVSTFFYVY